MSAADSTPSFVIYSHADCLQHQPPAGHPETPERLHAVRSALALMPQLEQREAPLATPEQLLSAHQQNYLDLLQQQQQSVLASTDPERIEALDEDTWLGRHTLAAAARCVGAVCAAVDAVLDVSDPCQRAFCAVRPPGHHAERDRAMGFCFYASTAIAALHAISRHDLQRVALVDFDVHQANGSADILAGHKQIMLFDSHQAELFPFMPPRADDAANIVSEALPQGCTGDYFRTIWRIQLLPRLRDFAPELIIVSAGFDAHQHDPLAQCALQAEDFAWLTQELINIANDCSGGRIVSSLEGGYHLDALAECVTTHVQTLAGDVDDGSYELSAVPGTESALISND